MSLESDSLLLLRGFGLLLGLFVVVSSFFRFRRREATRGETFLRWFFGLGLALVSAVPNSVNGLAALLAMETQTWGRMIALLVFSNLGLWLLLFRERSKSVRTAVNFDRLVRAIAQGHANPDEMRRLEEADVLVAMPALNEAENLPEVLARIPTEIGGKQVRAVVIDDGSTDDTAKVVRAAGHAVVSNPMRRGQGAALRLAYDLAQSVEAEVVVTMDSDGQHRPEEIKDVVEPILGGERDFVIGSRLLKGSHEKASWLRGVGIHVNNFLINLLAGTRISDCSSGFKAIRVSVLPKIDLREDQFQAAEAIISAAHAKVRMGEAPITVLARASGESKKGRDLAYGVGYTRTVFKSWWR